LPVVDAICVARGAGPGGVARRAHDRPRRVPLPLEVDPAPISPGGGSAPGPPRRGARSAICHAPR